MVDDIPDSRHDRAARGHAVRFETEVFRPPPQQQIERRQEDQYENSEPETGGAPSGIGDQRGDPGQHRDRADADPGEGNAERQPAAAYEPVRQIERLPGIGEAVDTAADERTQRQVKLPRLTNQNRQEQARPHHGDAELDHQSRTPKIHQPSDTGGDQGRNQKPEREGACGHAAIPAELVEDRREQ
jgi:hypothetical protein